MSPRPNGIWQPLLACLLLASLSACSSLLDLPDFAYDSDGAVLSNDGAAAPDASAGEPLADVSTPFLDAEPRRDAALLERIPAEEVETPFDGANVDAANEKDPDADEAPAADADAAPPAPCTPSERRCPDGSCARVDDPATGCGAVDCTPCSLPHVALAACAGTTCSVAQCAEGFGNCNDLAGCETSLTSSANCGACAHACSGATTLCSADLCVQGCGAKETCGNVCTNTLSDPNNCGRCGNVCPAPPNGDAVCKNKLCAVDCTQPGYATLCNGTCLNAKVDRLNCGKCGTECKTGASCQAGHCTCQAPLVECGGTCANIDTDVANCGKCKKACGPGKACTQGTCQDECPAGKTNCNGSCVDPLGDLFNCGTCGHVCSGLVCFFGNCL